MKLLVKDLRIALVSDILCGVDRAVIESAVGHVLDCLYHRVDGLLIEISHVILILTAGQLNAENIFDAGGEEGVDDVAVHAEGVNAAVLMKSGDVDSGDVETLFLGILCKDASDGSDVGACHAVSVKGGEDSDAPAVGDGNGPDLLIVSDLGRELLGDREAAAYIIVALKLLAGEQGSVCVADAPVCAVCGGVKEFIRAAVEVLGYIVLLCVPFGALDESGDAADERVDYLIDRAVEASLCGVCDYGVGAGGYYECREEHRNRQHDGYYFFLH